MITILTTLLSSGAFSTPLPWQAEVLVFMFLVLLAGLPHLIDSVDKYEHHDDEENQDASE